MTNQVKGMVKKMKKHTIILSNEKSVIDKIKSTALKSRISIG